MEIKTIYITKDGMEFASPSEAARHEEITEEVPEKRLRDNLVVYLSNKSRLKAGILKRDIEALNKAWSAWTSICPRSKLDVWDAQSAGVSASLRTLEKAATRYHCHLRDLKLAKEMIARINTTLRSDLDQKPLFDDLLIKAKSVKEW